eukprot:gnl/Dysnectes_brevis/639_a706_5935.p1 GENE.gnl/Dysnectes_brevis/639_a706_5935~~gnl/Dysnectes_brevis/639_a706_5935.p1  ORF type:complete len:243 (-),score=44.34 gnl/Dysnectes_brevis/639_a706_5935:49-777(-)
MPRSKRSSIIALTKTEKRVSARKNELIENVRNAFDDFTDVYVIAVKGMKTPPIQHVREDLRGNCRIFMGRNKVMQHALGKNEEDAYRPELHLIARLLKGNGGLLFVKSLDKGKILETLAAASSPISLKGGEIAPSNVSVPAGALDAARFPSCMEPELRMLGLPTQLRTDRTESGAFDTRIWVLSDTPIAVKGEPITAPNARLLRHFGHREGRFEMEVTGRWSKDGFELLKDELAHLLDDPEE